MNTAHVIPPSFRHEPGISRAYFGDIEVSITGGTPSSLDGFQGSVFFVPGMVFSLPVGSFFPDSLFFCPRGVFLFRSVFSGAQEFVFFVPGIGLSATGIGFLVPLGTFGARKGFSCARLK